MNTRFFIALCWFRIIEYVSGTEKVDFLKDYLIKIHSPRIVEAHLCWNRGQYTKLKQVLNEANVRYKLTTTIYRNEEHAHGLYHRIFLTDMDCPFFDSLIAKAFRKELYRFPNKWIIFGNLTNLKNRNYYFPINSYTVLIEEVRSNNTMKIQALYKTSKDSEYFEDILGVWSADLKEFLFFNELVMIQNRTNFFGMPLRVSYVMLDNSSLDHIRDNRHKHIDKLTKINYLMYEKLVDIWNMTHVPIVRNDWGLEFHPEKLYYKGMLGDLCYGRADVAGTVSFTPPERLKYFKYLLSTIKGLSLHFVFKAPPLAYSTNLFVLPFDGNVWIGCGMILSLCCLIIWTIVKWELKQKAFEEDREVYEENVPNFLDIVMMQIGVVCQMDYYHEPRSTSGKIATFTLLLGFSYIYTAFCARIVILLQSTTNNLNDVRALYDAKMDMGVEDTPYNRYYFSKPAKRTNEELRTLIFNNKIAPKGKTPNFFTATEGMKLVQNSYFAFHVELTTASNLIEASFSNEDKCSIRFVNTIFKEDVTHISCPRNSTYTEYLLIGFHKLFETGVHSRENRRKFTKLPKCTGKSSVFVSVGLIESYFAFQIFIIGVLLSLIIFFLELISDTYLKYRKKIEFTFDQQFKNDYIKK